MKVEVVGLLSILKDYYNVGLETIKKGITFWESLYTFCIATTTTEAVPTSCLPGLWAGKDQSSAFSSSNSI